MTDAAPGQIALSPSSQSQPAVRPGVIVLARHGRPALSREVTLSAKEYRHWWALYEEGGIVPTRRPPDHLVSAALRAKTIFTSTRRRAIESAQLLAPDRDLVSEKVFIEAPLPPPHWPDWLKLSPRKWGVISRLLWWYLNQHDNEESRAQAEVRAAEGARLLTAAAAGGDDVLLVAHGFINAMLGIQLRLLGWRTIKGRGWRYWSTRYFEKP